MSSTGDRPSHSRSISRVWDRITGSPAGPTSPPMSPDLSAAPLASPATAPSSASASASASSSHHSHAQETDSGLGQRQADDPSPSTPTPRSRAPSGAFPFAPGASPDDDDDEEEDELADGGGAQLPLSSLSFGSTAGTTPQTVRSPLPHEPASARMTPRSSSSSSVWAKIKVPRWGLSDPRREEPSLGDAGPSSPGRGGDGEEGSATEYDVLDPFDMDSDTPSPLDGEEGVVVDDEACFVDDCGQVDFLFSLPHEISLYVLLHLDFHSLLAAGSVSRQWRSLARDNLIWRDLFHRQQRWRVREDGLETAATFGLPSPVPGTPTASQRRLEARRNTASNDGSTTNRFSRRLTDMFADLGSLSLSPISGERRRNSIAQASPSIPSTGPRRITATNPFPLPVASTSQLPAGPMSRSPTSTEPPSLESSLSSLPFRRASSAALPPLGPVPSPSLGTPPSAPLFLDWPRLYKDRYLLEKRWDFGTAKMSILRGHTDSVYCLQFDQHKVISGSRDRTIRIWDLRLNQCAKTLKGHGGSVLCLQYDDKVLISGSSDCRIIVWDLVGEPGTGKGRWEQQMTLVGHNMGVLDLSFDEKWIVSCSKDTTIRVWHRSTGVLFRVLSGHSGPVNAVQLLNGRVISASGDSLLKLWSIDTGEVVRVFTGHARGLACAQLSPSGKLVATGSNDKTVKVWDTETGKCLVTLEGHTDLVRSLAFDEVRRRLVSASYDRTLRLWDLDDGAPLLRFKAHTSLVFDVAFSASKILSCSHDQKIVIQDFGDGLDVSKFL